MAMLLQIENDRVVIDKIKLNDIEGPISLSDSLNVKGTASFDNVVSFNADCKFNTPIDFADVVKIHSNLLVSNTLTADTIHVKHLITDSAIPTNSDVGNWVFDSESELNGSGLKWSYIGNSTQLIYRTGNRLWTSSDIDLKSGQTYKIDDNVVLSENQLGNTITKSNLRQLGTLSNLSVSGNSTLGDFVYINSLNKRIGINTTAPTSNISIVENSVELNIGTNQIGTRTNHDLVFITDNRPRLTIKQNGDVVVNKLYASEIVTTKNEHNSSLTFTNDSIFNLGLIWEDELNKHSLVQVPGKLLSSVSLAVPVNKSFIIGEYPVITYNSLGSSIVNSNLTSVGELTSLSVAGTASVEKLIATDISSRSLSTTTLSTTAISSKSDYRLFIQDNLVMYADNNVISLGDPSKESTIKLFGKVSIGVNNPDPTMGLTVNGPVSFDNKKFINSNTMPSTGNFTKGDISWNTDPTLDGYVGWICITSGTPGTWAPFGAINRTIRSGLTSL
jgi:hypothetical protein